MTKEDLRVIFNKEFEGVLDASTPLHAAIIDEAFEAGDLGKGQCDPLIAVDGLTILAEDILRYGHAIRRTAKRGRR
jgi:hypothetical protein